MSSGPIGKILIVDDEVELKNVLVEALAAQGYETTGFTAGEEALAALRDKSFDILLTDLMMPTMDGITLVTEGLQIDPHLIAIMMTGQGTIQTAVDAMKVGAFDYVLKPFRLLSVLPVLTRAMNARHLRLENLQLRETVAIYELGQTIAFTLDPQTVISKLADAALQQTDADEVSILLPTTEGSDELYVASVRGQNRERLLGERVPLGEGIAGWVAREREPLILDGEVNDRRFRSLWPHPEIRSALSIPMQVAGKLVGVININALSRPRPFTLGQMKALTILASTAAAALESASLFGQVQRAEQNYRSIFENAVEGIFQCTADGRFLEVNPALAKMLGYGSPEAVLSSFTDSRQQLYVRPEQAAEVTCILEDVGVVQGYEFEAYRKAGEKIWLSLNIRLVRDQTGVEVYREGTLEDISERRRSEVERLLMFEIIQGVITTPNLDELLKLVHTSISRLLDAENCFVALHDPATNLMHYEYWADKYDPAPAPLVLGTGFVSYVVRTSQRLLLTKELKSEMEARGDVIPSGRPALSWLGVPLRTPSGTIGALVLQHYETERAYTQRDLEFLSSVGDQVAVAIERKRAEQELSRSEERYRDLVENAQDIIYSHDLKGNYLSSNKASEEITGYTLEESLRLNLAQAVAPEYVEKAREMLGRKLAGENVTAYELELIAKDGHHVPVEVNTRLVLENGVPIGVTGVARDITARKQAEAELRRLAAAVEETADSIVITDKDGNIQYVNPAFERVTGYTKEEVLNQNPRLLKSGKTDEAVFRELWETITRGDVWTGHLINRRKNGTFFEERVTISAIYSESREIINYVAVKQDISDLMLLEDQLRQSQKMEAIGQLAGGVAHDFNNLLTAINGYSSLALQRMKGDSVIKGYLEEIKKAGDRAANLTRQLLAFGRKQMLQPVALNLNDVVGDMNKMLRRLIGEDIQLTAKFDPALRKTKADPGQIEQVLVNLVVNARDAMPTGGHLTIETANFEIDSEYALRHVGVHPGRYVALKVSDTGTGMDEETKARIFEPFFTTKEKGKGTGLGLSTVYGIVKQSGGNIWVYSEPGRGTSFKVYLPQTEDATETYERTTIETAPSGGSETILVVEDEDVVRGLTREILEGAGYKVLEASGGAEALRLCEETDEPIHLLLTDVVMPETSGREVAEQLKLLRPNLSVLFMSGYTDAAIVHHGILDSTVEFIQKPFNPRALVEKVREVLDLKLAVVS